MCSFDPIFELERAERMLKKAEDAKDIDSFNHWYSELVRIRKLMESYPLR